MDSVLQKVAPAVHVIYHARQHVAALVDVVVVHVPVWSKMLI